MKNFFFACTLLVSASLCLPRNAVADEGRQGAVGDTLDGLQSGAREPGFTLSGDMWVDTGYEFLERGLEGDKDITFWLQQGRFMLRAEAVGMYNQFFVKARGEILAHVNEIYGAQLIDTDDAWGQVGIFDKFDVQIGRMEFWEVYHKGRGLERDTLEDLGANYQDDPDTYKTDIYEVNYCFYRQDGLGQAAIHWYPAKILRFELGACFGNELKFNAIGVRPAGILDLGYLKIKMAAEYRKRQNEREGANDEDIKRGFGGSIQGFINGRAFGFLGPLAVGINGAYGIVDIIDPFDKVDEKGSIDTLSMGAFADLGLGSAVLAGGGNYTLRHDRQWNNETDENGRFDHLQIFASIEHPLVVPEAIIKLVVAYAKAELDPSFDNSFVNKMYSIRLRFFYEF